jgi:hypothetical protein
MTRLLSLSPFLMRPLRAAAAVELPGPATG